MRIAFFSTMDGQAWGGSEELWSRAARVLLREGHQVAFNYPRWPKAPQPLVELIEAGASPHFRLRLRLGRSLRQALERLRLIRLRHAKWLRAFRPDLVVVNLGYHTSDPQVADACRAFRIPYALLVQAAGHDRFVGQRHFPDLQTAYAAARHVYFVSSENRDTVETNVAVDLAGATVVDNPFGVRIDAAPPWPVAAPLWKLACPARIHFAAKAQDLLVRVLRQPKWRARPLQVTLYGSDHGNLGQLRELINVFGLHKQLVYGGFASDIERLWADHHGLILPSRIEGNAISLIEAMVCGRVPIVTNVGRAAELIDDNTCGFIAPAATAELVDEALERAYGRRHEWQAMGRRAAEAIRQRHSLSPAEDFAHHLLGLLGQQRPPSGTRSFDRREWAKERNQTSPVAGRFEKTVPIR